MRVLSTEQNSKSWVDAILEFIDGLERASRVIEHISRSVGEVARSVHSMAKQGVSGADTERIAVRDPGNEAGNSISTGEVVEAGEDGDRRHDGDSHFESSPDSAVGL